MGAEKAISGHSGLPNPIIPSGCQVFWSEVVDPIGLFDVHWLGGRRVVFGVWLVGG